MGFINQYRQAKTGPRRKRKVDGLVKNRIYRLREDNRDCCGQKIRYHLKEEYGLSLSTTTIYKILSEKYQLRFRWKKNQSRRPVLKATQPRQVVQMDTIDLGKMFAFTGIDIFAKETAVKLYSSPASDDGANFLDYSMKTRFRQTDLLQTDGGPEFKGRFRQQVFLFANRFRVAKPYKKNEQTHIESFNRNLRKECLRWSKYAIKDILLLETELKQYLDYYRNKRPRLSLGLKTPNQMLKEYNASVSDI